MAVEMKVKLRCAVYREGSVFSVEIERNAEVEALQEKIAGILSTEQHTVPPRLLTLYLARKAGESVWLADDRHVKNFLQGGISTEYEEMRPSWELDEDYFGKNFQPGRKEIHVLVELPDAVVPVPTIEPRVQALQQDVVWYGVRGTLGRLQGIDPNDCRTLSRMALTNDIIRRVDEMHVLLIKSPPMTGKTSLATLVSRNLVNRSIAQRRLAKVFSVAALQLSEDETFLGAFQRQCGVDWDSAMSLSTQGYTIYLVMDEVQILYKDPTSSPRRKSSVFWELVKLVRNDATSAIRILMFGAYGSDPQYTQSMTPVDFSVDMVLGIDHLNFRREEIEEYVEKWFVGVKCLQNTMKTFCDCLQWLTGGHVGLCTVAIDVLNTVYFSRVGSGGVAPSAYDWHRMLEQGSLYREKDHALFDALTSTRAVKVLKTLNMEELNGLERLVYGVENQLDAQLLDECIRKGILIGCQGRVEFSSPVMWRHFIKMRVGHVERALHGPNTLQEMIARVVRVINYDSIRKTLGRTLSNDIPLERAWQMEFYKAAYRCTPSTCMTSADIGALFGSTGFIDFTVDCGDDFWGIELLREGSKLDEHIDRFAPGGPYSLLQLSDYCLVDFRRVSSMDDTTMATITTDLNRCEKLYVVCYDSTLAHVSVLNVQFAWNIF